MESFGFCYTYISGSPRWLSGRRIHLPMWINKEEKLQADLTVNRVSNILNKILTNCIQLYWGRKWQPTPVFLPGESQGRWSLGGCRIWDHRVGHDWSNLAVAAAASHIARYLFIGALGVRLLQHFGSGQDCVFKAWDFGDSFLIMSCTAPSVSWANTRCLSDYWLKPRICKECESSSISATHVL